MQACLDKSGVHLSGLSLKQAGRANERKTRFESLGVYLPPKIITTADLFREIKPQPNWDLEKITGIHERHMAENESIFDCALSAVKNALTLSKHPPEEIDVIVSTGSAIFDHKKEHMCEPCLSSMIKGAIKAHNAIHFDISNGCVGMFSGIAIIDNMIRNGEVKTAIVVSGELPLKLHHIVSRDFYDVIDESFIRLTFGDAGAAVVLDGSAENGFGLHYINLSTMPKYCNYNMMILSEPSWKSIIKTESLIQDYVAYDHLWPMYKEALDQTGWTLKDLNAFIPQQTSRGTIKKSKEVIEQGFREKLDNVFIDNLEKYGNTGSNTSFIALHENILNGRIQSGCNIMFGIFAPGFIMGMATYTMDDLPDRYRMQHSMMRESL